MESTLLSNLVNLLKYAQNSAEEKKYFTCNKNAFIAVFPPHIFQVINRLVSRKVLRLKESCGQTHLENRKYIFFTIGILRIFNRLMDTVKHKEYTEC